MAKEVELAAVAVRVKLQYLDVSSPNDIEPAFRAAREGRADAGFMLVSGSILGGSTEPGSPNWRQRGHCR
ncbi:MAG TPA: hypothetical protein VIE89_35415 [Candidatus Binatia bacterium]